MTDRPIIFSGPMVRALLAGTKVQTRRILKVKLHEGVNPRFSQLRAYPEGSGWRIHGSEEASERFTVPYAAGDRLWVRETWQAPAMNDHLAPRDMPTGLARRYLADDAEVIGFGADVARRPIGAAGRTRPGIHMPRWASRLTLDVTEVRVERLNDISEADAIAEGCRDHGAGFTPDPSDIIGAPPVPTARWAFQCLWCRLHGPQSWEANPWIAAISFRATPANIDSLPSTPSA